jgi:predicted transcriptional regulator
VEGAQNADAVKFVVSAYVQRNPLAKSRLPSVSFETLIVKAVQGEPITSPKK